MTTKSLLMIGTLALASLASAKSYDIMLASPVKAGNIQLAPGEYRLKLENGNAVFSNVENGKQFTAPVKVQNAEKKFDMTAVDTTKQSGNEQIQSIELGGSNTKLEFGE